jgi:hypothetical protein
LRLKGLYNQSSFQYNYALKVTAAYTTDRSVLFDFITSDTFTAIHKGVYEQKLAELYGIEVKGIEVVTKADASETDTDKVEKSILTLIRESEVPFVEEVVLEDTIEIVPEPIFSDEVKVIELDNLVIAMPEAVTSIAEIEEKDVISEVPVDIEVVDNAPETPEAKLEIGKPLEFSRDEKHSFQEWLQLSAMKPIVRTSIPDNEPQPVAVESAPNEFEIQKVKKKALIDQFIRSNPKIPPIRQDIKVQPAQEAFREDTSALMTETLARVYLEQKKYQKAIQAYEILILKYPEKSTFFADRISEVKNLQQNNI